MNWLNLKRCECPKCNSTLSHGLLDDKYDCSNPECDFSISDARFEEITSDMGKPKKQKDLPERSNLFGLNNLGHRKPSKDYSDKL